jgi:hypothetical protein
MVLMAGVLAALMAVAPSTDAAGVDPTESEPAVYSRSDGWKLENVYSDSVGADTIALLEFARPGSDSDLVVGVFPQPGDTTLDVLAEVDATLQDL